jgi:hypothetical protein
VAESRVELGDIEQYRPRLVGIEDPGIPDEPVRQAQRGSGVTANVESDLQVEAGVPELLPRFRQVAQVDGAVRVAPGLRDAPAQEGERAQRRLGECTL